MNYYKNNLFDVRQKRNVTGNKNTPLIVYKLDYGGIFNISNLLVKYFRN